MWRRIFISPHAIPFIEAHWEEAIHPDQEFSIKLLCENPNAILLLEKHYAFLRSRGAIHWEYICENPSADAIAFLEKHLEDAKDAAANAIAATGYSRSGINMISWSNLCANPHPSAIQFLEKHWNRTSSLIICQKNLCANPAIFTLDWAAMCNQARPFAEELAAKVFHPRRVEAALAAGIDVEDL